MALSNPITELLLSMKLTGMEEAFAEQLRTPGHRELDFEDQLALLLEREREHRRDRSCRTRLRQAQLRQQAEIRDVCCTAGRGIAQTTLLHLAAGHWIGDGANVVIVGKTGAGKTFLACALAHQACLQNRSVLYRRVPQLLAELAEARAVSKLPRLMRRIERIELLVLDDWGLQSLPAEARRDMLEVIEARCMRRSTIVASQLPVEEWHRSVGEDTIADPIRNRSPTHRQNTLQPNTSRTSCPSSMIPRPHQWALAQASMATGQFGCDARKSKTLCRTSFLRNTTDPSAAAPCNWNQIFARSIPIMLTFSVDVRSFQGSIKVDATMAHYDAVGQGASNPSVLGVYGGST